MGLVNSSSSDGRKELATVEGKGEKIHRLKEEKMIKLLLFGPGECGKTTILRRMMINQKINLKKEKKESRANICFNVIEGAYILLRSSQVVMKFNFLEEGATQTIAGVEYTVTEEDALHARRIFQAMGFFQQNTRLANLNESRIGFKEPNEYDLPHGPAVVESILYLYDTNAFFQKMVDRRNKFALFENWIYFVEKLRLYPAQWGGPDWNPSDEDLLMCRVRTTGLNKLEFFYDNTKYNLIDVGGQRLERKKFFTLFKKMDCVLFVASLADYNETLFEQNNVNKLVEAMNVWKDTVYSDDFENIWVVLYLNKVDLFRKKYYEQKIPILSKKLRRSLGCEAAPTWDQEVSKDCDLALGWFENLFTSCITGPRRQQVRAYITSAIGDENIDHSMNLTVNFLRERLLEV